MGRLCRFCLLMVFLLLPGGLVQAEEQNDLKEIMSSFSYDTVARPEPPAQAQTPEAVQLEIIKNNRHYVMITAGLLAFSLVIITFLMRITPHQARDLVTIIGLVSVIFGTILTVLVVDTHEALTAPMGIFGAIAGYLFGVAQKKDADKEYKPGASQDPQLR